MYVWVSKSLTLAGVVQQLWLCRRNRPAHFCFVFCSNHAELFLRTGVYTTHTPIHTHSHTRTHYTHTHSHTHTHTHPQTMRMQVQGEQLHQPHLMAPCRVVYLDIIMCFGQHFVTVTSDYDHVLCASVQTLCCVPLCTAT